MTLVVTFWVAWRVHLNIIMRTVRWSEGRDAGNLVLTAELDGWRVMISRIGQQCYATLRAPFYVPSISRRFMTWADAQAWADRVLLAEPGTQTIEALKETPGGTQQWST